jgi:hypothetical protein
MASQEGSNLNNNWMSLGLWHIQIRETGAAPGTRRAPSHRYLAGFIRKT